MVFIMKDKCNKIYSLFNENIVISKNTCINAITPYDIYGDFRVMGFDDVIDYCIRNYITAQYIKDSKLYSFTNPVTNDWWYLGKYFVAYCNKKATIDPYLSMPKIIMVFGERVSVVDENHLDDCLKLKRVLYRNKNAKINIMLTSNIGYLSYPSMATVNSGINVSEIKLPIVLT